MPLWENCHKRRIIHVVVLYTSGTKLMQFVYSPQILYYEQSSGDTTSTVAVPVAVQVLMNVFLKVASEYTTCLGSMAAVVLPTMPISQSNLQEN